jgi:glycosyltransferase involved in cell wall biosynthesis
MARVENVNPRQMDTVVLAPAGYLVDPDLGSDYERPWRLAEGLAKRGLRVVMVAREARRLKELGSSVELERPPGHTPSTPLGRILDRANLYLHARRVAHREVSAGRALVIHHYGPCSEQSPSLIGTIPVPFVYGPMPGSRPADSGDDEWLTWLLAPHAARAEARLSKIIARPAGVPARWLWRRTVHRADSITVEAQANVPNGHRKIAVIPPGIDSIQFSPRIHGEPVTGRVVAVGSLIDRKGYDVLIRAVAQVARNYRAAHLLLIGSGPQEQALRLLSSQLGITGSITFAGKINRAELPSVLQSAEAFCHPARWDTFPFAPLEAMACGLPTLVSSAGALPEIVGDAGIVHTVDDEHDLARRLLEVLSNESLRRSLGTAARARVEEHFTWQAMCDGYLGLYLRLAGARGLSGKAS